jgi:hypothetical protein
MIHLAPDADAAWVGAGSCDSAGIKLTPARRRRRS